MFNWLKGKKNDDSTDQERLENEWAEQRDILMEAILGKEYNLVRHAIIPFAVGGALDLYYYPNSIPGTGIATKELTYACAPSASNNRYDRYELVMFTKLPIDLETADDGSTPFGKTHRNINSILNTLALYCLEKNVNPHDTLEFPKEMENIGGKCLIIDSYKPENTRNQNPSFGLMVVIEVFCDEMEYAMKNGSESILAKLKEAGYYPYSDLDRPSVIKN